MRSHAERGNEVKWLIFFEKNIACSEGSGLGLRVFVPDPLRLIRPTGLKVFSVYLHALCSSRF